jgi:hypothetical protein
MKSKTVNLTDNQKQLLDEALNDLLVKIANKRLSLNPHDFSQEIAIKMLKIREVQVSNMWKQLLI